MLTYLIVILVSIVSVGSLVYAACELTRSAGEVVSAIGTREIYRRWAAMNRGQRRFTILVGMLWPGVVLTTTYVAELLGVRISEFILLQPTNHDPALLIATVWPHLLAANTVILALAVWWLERQRKQGQGW